MLTVMVDSYFKCFCLKSYYVPKVIGINICNNHPQFSKGIIYSNEATCLNENKRISIGLQKFHLDNGIPDPISSKNLIILRTLLRTEFLESFSLRKTNVTT